jgi:phosphocarrier protein FPr
VIGLVIVSHSARLAAGVVELAAQMGGQDLRIATAAGLDQPGGPLGTDAALVARAVEQVWSDDGVLVLMDLGSAVLSAELALDLLPEDRRPRVLLTEAPLVEGAVAAAVAAGLGEPLHVVAAEARGGLAAKTAHLAPGDAATAAGPRAVTDRSPAGQTLTLDLRLIVRNPLGLHARPAAALVRTAAGFEAEVTVADATIGRGPVSARSLNAVATLGVRSGHEIVVRASGPQADEALAAIERLAEERFGDPAGLPQGGPAPAVTPATATAAAPVAAVGPDASAAPPPGTVLRGSPASPGIAVGRARRLRPADVEVPAGPAEDPAADWAALEGAIAATAADIRRTRASAAVRAGEYEAGIFDAHVLLVRDEELLGPAHEGVFKRGLNAARSWADATAAAAAQWERLDDPYLRARAADVRSVGDQVLRQLLVKPARDVMAGEGIVIAADLTPAQTTALDRSLVRGIACASGGPTSHSAILARSLGIPAVYGLGDLLLNVPEGTLLALDGAAGSVAVAPGAGEVRALEDRQAERDRQEAAAREGARRPAATRDGVAVHVAANVAAPADIAAALAAGADGVGLLRTEFLFLEADHLPDEDEQERAYRAAVEALGGRPLTLRTLDAGADKQLPTPAIPREDNPFLGVRGVRLSLRHPELLLEQLRAALRAAAGHPLRLMFPMVATVSELLRARAVLDEARRSLPAADRAVPGRVEVGIMVEVPAAALLAEAFVPHVDFFSLGTNDLAQYTMAADRGNADVAPLADALHPAVLRLIETTASAGARGGKAVALCGEVAGDPLAVPLLLGLGVRELSMAPAMIADVKQAVRATDLPRARGLGRAALAAASAAEVRSLCAEALGRRA